MNYLDKYANDQSRFLVLDGSLVHYRLEGKGPPLLLIHGAFSSLHTFDAWTDQLSSNYSIVRFDLPGFGLSGSRTDHDYTMSRYIEVLAGFLDRLEIKKCHIAGSSLGGWLAWEFALRYPNRVNKLILISSAGFLENRNLPLPFRVARTPILGRAIKFAANKNVLEQFLRQVYTDQSKITPEVIDRYFDLFNREGNPEAFLALANGQHHDHTSGLKQVPHQTLILWGEDDLWLPLENGYRFRDRIPNSRLIIYEGVGHVPMEEAPTATAQDVLKFLKGRMKD